MLLRFILTHLTRAIIVTSSLHLALFKLYVVIVFFRLRRAMITTQYNTFWRQNLTSVIIYIPVLIAIAWIINTDPTHSYPHTTILDNFEFNLTIALIIFIGCASLVLSYNPNCIKMLMCCSKQSDALDDHLYATEDHR